jgi:hypothetical protein
MTTTEIHSVQPAPAPSPPPTSSWTTRRIVALSLASAAVLASGAMGAVAGGVHLIDEHHRDGAYLTTDTVHLGSSGHAVTVEDIDLDGLNGDWLLGTARIRATAADGSSVFVGVAPADDVADYLDDVGYSTVTELDDPAYDHHPGGPPSEAPADSDIWTAQKFGAGTQTVTWKPQDGDWTVVVMKTEATAGVDVRADVGATAPILHRAVTGLLIASVLSAAAGGLGLLMLLVTARRRPVTRRAPRA